MLTIADCIEMSGLSEAEIDAIAEHEHVPEIIACEIAQYLSRCPGGTGTIKAMIEDDLRVAVARGDMAHARQLKAVLEHFKTARWDAAKA
ncbi:MAG TPA: hypothetical protein VD978_07120 [Azospirillum sp.]|nr:hypothetical protein [Azospirillum sp.]